MSSLQNLRIGQINVRGMSDDKKRARLFKEWREKYDILFAGETHCSNTRETLWSNEWGGHSLWSNQSNNAGGCAILTRELKLKPIFTPQHIVRKTLTELKRRRLIKEMIFIKEKIIFYNRMNKKKMKKV